MITEEYMLLMDFPSYQWLEKSESKQSLNSTQYGSQERVQELELNQHMGVYLLPNRDGDGSLSRQIDRISSFNEFPAKKNGKGVKGRLERPLRAREKLIYVYARG